jgi:hypothetical protein
MLIIPCAHSPRARAHPLRSEVRCVYVSCVGKEERRQRRLDLHTLLGCGSKQQQTHVDGVPMSCGVDCLTLPRPHVGLLSRIFSNKLLSHVRLSATSSRIRMRKDVLCAKERDVTPKMLFGGCQSGEIQSGTSICGTRAILPLLTVRHVFRLK